MTCINIEAAYRIVFQQHEPLSVHGFLVWRSTLQVKHVSQPLMLAVPSPRLLNIHPQQKFRTIHIVTAKGQVARGIFEYTGIVISMS